MGDPIGGREGGSKSGGVSVCVHGTVSAGCVSHSPGHSAHWFSTPEVTTALPTSLGLRSLICLAQGPLHTSPLPPFLLQTPCLSAPFPPLDRACGGA